MEDSVCRSCYALRGFFRIPKVRQAYQRRLDRYGADNWIDAMVKLVYWQAAETGQLFFRWFDSGDLRDIDKLITIVAVAHRTPEIWQWLPTREYSVLREYLRSEAPPPNLTIRVSAPMVDGPAPTFGLATSGVHTQSPGAETHECPAYSQSPANCGNCRTCWDQMVLHISYPLVYAFETLHNTGSDIPPFIVKFNDSQHR